MFIRLLITDLHTILCGENNKSSKKKPNTIHSWEENVKSRSFQEEPLKVIPERTDRSGRVRLLERGVAGPLYADQIDSALHLNQ